MISCFRINSAWMEEVDDAHGHDSPCLLAWMTIMIHERHLGFVFGVAGGKRKRNHGLLFMMIP